MTFTVNEHLLPTDPVERAKVLEEIAEKKYPTLKQLFDKMKLQNVPHIKIAILKRIHIIIDYLKMPVLPEGMEPTLEYSLGLLGRAEISLSLIEEVGKIFSDASGYSLIKIYPREAVQLREHIRDQQNLARQIVIAIAFQKIKETGIYEPKAEVNTGTPVPDKGSGVVGTGS